MQQKPVCGNVVFGCGCESSKPSRIPRCLHYTEQHTAYFRRKKPLEKPGPCGYSTRNTARVLLTSFLKIFSNGSVCVHAHSDSARSFSFSAFSAARNRAMRICKYFDLF